MDRPERGNRVGGESCSTLTMVYRDHRSDGGGSSSADTAARRHSESSQGSARDEERPKSRDDREDSKYSSDYSRGSSRYKEGRYLEGSRSRNGKDDGKYGDGSRYSKDSRSGNGREEGKYYDRSRDGRKECSRYREGKDDGRYSESGSRYSDSARYPESSRHSDSRYPEASRYSSGGSRFSSSGGNGDGWYSESSRYREDGSRFYGGGSSRYHGEDSGGRDEREAAQYGAEDAASDDLAENAAASSEQEKLKNVFQNDGSFLEMFKKMQEAHNKTEPEAVETPSSEPSAPETSTSVKQEVVPRQGAAVSRRGIATGIVGKRRGGRVLPTGMVKKQKREEEEVEKPKDAWSLYMAEVRKYKEASCEEEGKTRPLVK